MAQASETLSRNPSSAVHCVITAGGTVQTVSSRGVVMLDVQSREIGTDGHARYAHASIGLFLADANDLLRQLTDSIAEASAPRDTVPADGWQTRLAPPETARWGVHPRRAVDPGPAPCDLTAARHPRYAP